MIRQIIRRCTEYNQKYHAELNRIRRKTMPNSNIMKLDPGNHCQWFMCVQTAMEYLLRGQVVAIPTDTLYGLVTLAENADKLYKIKGRPSDKPLGVFVRQPTEIKKFCKQTVSDELLKAIYPGPVTVLFQRSADLPSDLNPGVNSIGFRVPQAHFARDLCTSMPYRLLAQTSANVSGSDRNPLCIEDFREIWDDIDLIIDGGTIVQNNGSRQGSTVVDLCIPGEFKLLRAGCAPIETMEILREFGLRSTEEMERARIEAGQAKRALLKLEIEERQNTEEPKRQMKKLEGTDQSDNIK